MALVHLNLPWDSQPQEKAELAADIPAPSLLFLGNAPSVPIADRSPVLSAVSIAAGKVGLGTRLGSGGYVSITTNADKYLSTDGGSALVVMSRRGAAVASNAFAFGTYNTAVYRFSAHLPWSDGNIYWDFGGDSGVNRLSTAVSFVDDQVSVFVLTAGAAGMRIWRDGVLLATSSSPATRGNPTGCFFGLGISSATTGTVVDSTDTGATYYMQSFWANQLPDAVAQRLSIDPWQLFAPRQIWIPASGSISVVPTLSLPTAINITASSFQPRVSYAF